MRINKFNSEGYYDPTAYEALSSIWNEMHQRKYRPIIYVCSPFSGNVEENVIKTRGYCRFVVKQGGIPLAPHLLFPQFMDDNDTEERNLAIFMDIVLLSKCAELWAFGDTISRGMNIEIQKARYKGQTVRYFNENCEEVLK